MKTTLNSEICRRVEKLREIRERVVRDRCVAIVKTNSRIFFLNSNARRKARTIIRCDVFVRKFVEMNCFVDENLAQNKYRRSGKFCEKYSRDEISFRGIFCELTIRAYATKKYTSIRKIVSRIVLRADRGSFVIRRDEVEPER